MPGSLRGETALSSLAHSVTVRAGTGDQWVKQMAREQRETDKGPRAPCSHRHSGHEWVRFEEDNEREVGKAEGDLLCEFGAAHGSLDLPSHSSMPLN